MNKNKIFIKISVILIAIMSTACDGFLDINESPNAVKSVPPKFLLAGTTAAVGFHMGSDIHRYSSLFAQQFTGGGGVGVQTVEFSQYNITATDVNNVWRNAFYGMMLSDLEQLVMATETTSPKYSGIAKVLKAYLFAVAVDAWGNIPYTDALKFAGNVKPVYDNSQDIYNNIFGLIDAGLADMAVSTNLLTPGADDLIYAGNLTKWKKFANTLKLRMLVKFYPTQTASANTRIANLLAATPAADFITSNADNFELAFVTTTNQTNSIDQFERRRLNQFWPTTTLVTLMGASDPRRSVYFTTPTGGILGLAPGSTTVSPSTSRIHTYLRGAVTGTNLTNPANPNTGYTGDAPQRMLTYAEHNFNLAEYYLRSGDDVSAQAAYERGLRASLSMAAISETNTTAFMALPLVTLTGTLDTKLRQIIEQKYIANYGVAMEPWSDWRRTGYPVLALSNGAVLTEIPRILPYSDLERVTNPTNTPVREKEDLIKSNVFWDPKN